MQSPNVKSIKLNFLGGFQGISVEICYECQNRDMGCQNIDLRGKQ